jgi:diacylglycerol kinase (ATP)
MSMIFKAKKRFRAFSCAIRGVVLCITQEPHGRFHALAAIIVILVGVMLNASVEDWCWFIVCIGMVMATEAVNTSIERLSNRVSEEHHELIRDAKDLAAGAVLVVSVASAIIGLLRMWPLLTMHLNL